MTDSRRRICRNVAPEKPDVVHVHNTWVMISPSIYSACREAGVPVVQTLHNYRLLCPVGTFFRDGKVCEECLDHTLWRSMPKRVLSRLSRRNCGCGHHAGRASATRHTWEREVESYIVLSEFARKKFLQGGLPPEKIFVKPNFVDPDPAAAGRERGLRHIRGPALAGEARQYAAGCVDRPAQPHSSYDCRRRGTARSLGAKSASGTISTWSSSPAYCLGPEP